MAAELTAPGLASRATGWGCGSGRAPGRWRRCSACSQAGGAYVPLDPLAPARASCGQIIRDAGLRCLVTGSRAAGARLRPGSWCSCVTSCRPRRRRWPDPAWPPRTPRLPALHLRQHGSAEGRTPDPPQRAPAVARVGRESGPDARRPAEPAVHLRVRRGGPGHLWRTAVGAAVCSARRAPFDRETLLDRIADRGLTVLHATPDRLPLPVRRPRRLPPGPVPGAAGRAGRRGGAPRGLRSCSARASARARVRQRLRADGGHRRHPVVRGPRHAALGSAAAHRLARRRARGAAGRRPGMPARHRWRSRPRQPRT